MPKEIGISPGDQFERLTVIERVEDFVDGNGKRRSQYLCECNCENHTRIKVVGTYLKSGNVKSCGCLQKENGRNRGLANTKFGISSTKIAQAYYNMQNKCNNPAYGGYINKDKDNKIGICDTWNRNDNGIKQFYDDMSPTYQEGYVLTRIDPTKDYSPENCQWVPGKYRNSSSTRSRMLTVEDTTFTMSQWTIALGYSKNLISDRLRAGRNDHDAVLGYPNDTIPRNAIYFVDEFGRPISQSDERYNEG